MLLHPARHRPARRPATPSRPAAPRAEGAASVARDAVREAAWTGGRRARARPLRHPRHPDGAAARGSGYRWERFADAAFYGAAASLALLLVARQLTGASGLLPPGPARPALLAACVLVAIAVTTAVATRR